jgi:hypothetical protein
MRRCSAEGFRALEMRAYDRHAAVLRLLQKGDRPFRGVERRHADGSASDAQPDAREQRWVDPVCVFEEVLRPFDVLAVQPLRI